MVLSTIFLFARSLNLRVRIHLHRFCCCGYYSYGGSDGGGVGGHCILKIPAHKRTTRQMQNPMNFISFYTIGKRESVEMCVHVYVQLCVWYFCSSLLLRRQRRRQQQRCLFQFIIRRRVHSRAIAECMHKYANSVEWDHFYVEWILLRNNRSTISIKTGSLLRHFTNKVDHACMWQMRFSKFYSNLFWIEFGLTRNQHYLLVFMLEISLFQAAHIIQQTFIEQRNDKCIIDESQQWFTLIVRMLRNCLYIFLRILMHRLLRRFTSCGVFRIHNNRLDWIGSVLF